MKFILIIQKYHINEEHNCQKQREYNQKQCPIASQQDVRVKENTLGRNPEARTTEGHADHQVPEEIRRIQQGVTELHRQLGSKIYECQQTNRNQLKRT